MKQMRLGLYRRSDWKGPRKLLHLRVTGEQWQLVRDAAKKSGKPLNDYLCGKIFKAGKS